MHKGFPETRRAGAVCSPGIGDGVREEDGVHRVRKHRPCRATRGEMAGENMWLHVFKNLIEIIIWIKESFIFMY